MIKSFRDGDTQALFAGEVPRRFRGIAEIARRKLDMIDYATRLDDLARPPGNRLEALRGDRKGRYSIRINGQWRICFAWSGGAIEVEIVDYH
ncbi:MAG: type II toxin-antitoxin system RelE/ParE family toxin [Rhodospirillales bacterium]|nr:type II toxin-antitoxin system RelE/ParE family toxin [Rhodospirillales bacterium]